MKRLSVILSIALALPALAASYSSGSRSYSSGSRSSSSSGSRSYSSGSRSYSSGSSSKPSYSAPTKSYSSPSSSAAKAMKVQESQKSYSSYQQKAAPASAPNKYTGGYSTRSSSTRGYSDPDYWSKRRERERRVFGSPQTTVVHNYSDGISPMFWGFLIGQSINNQAAWAYHHRDSMDDARYRELLARDATLEAKVKAMEAEGIKRDPNYLPEGVDEDLVYSKPDIATEKEDDGTGFFTWLLVLTIIGGAGYLAYYFGFKKKYTF